MVASGINEMGWNVSVIFIQVTEVVDCSASRGLFQRRADTLTHIHVFMVKIGTECMCK